MGSIMMESHPLLTGLRSRLQSCDIKLKDKLTLITNIYKASAPIPHKDSLILEWILTTLDQKYSDKSIKQKDIEKMWILLKLCLESVHKEGVKVAINEELILNIIDRADLSFIETVSSIILIVQILSNKESESQMISCCMKLVKKEICPENLLAVILEKVSSCPDAELNQGLFLSEASRHMTEKNEESFSVLCKTVVLANTKHFEGIFSKKVESEDVKENTILFDYLSNKGNLVYILKAANDSKLFPLLRTRLFILGCYLGGQDELFAQSESVLLAKLKLSLETKLDLKQVIINSLPLELSYVHDIQTSSSEKKTILVSRILSEALIEVLDSDGITNESFETIKAVYNSHPTILETLAPLLITRCLQHKNSHSHAILNLLIELMLKLRQFPKLVSKILLYLRSDGSSSSEILEWDSDYLEDLGKAVLQIPRTQSLEIWKTLLYHLSTDCINSKENTVNPKFWSVISPILGLVYTHAQLIDHNVPEPLAARIVELINSTFKDVFLPLYSVNFPSEKCRSLFEILTSDFLGFVEAVSLYRNIQFIEISSKKDAIIKNITSRKEVGGYIKLVQSEIQSGSESKDVLCKTFRKTLSKDPSFADYFPTENLESETMDFSENSDWIAISLHAEFVKLHKSSKTFEKLADKCLWTETLDWSSRNSDIANILKSEVSMIFNVTANYECDKLQNLPLENLPPVLKLAATLLVFTSVFTLPSDLNVVSLARCLEDTDIFKYIDTSVLLKKILAVKLELPSCLLETLALELTRHLKMLTEIEKEMEHFGAKIQESAGNYVHLFTLYLGKLTKVGLNTSVSEERRSAAKKLSSLILKNLMKMAKHDLSEHEVPYHVKAGVAVLEGSSEDLGSSSKVDKYLKRVINASGEHEVGLELVDKLLESADEAVGKLVDSDLKMKAWKLVLGSQLTEEKVSVGAKILQSLPLEELERFLNIDGNEYVMTQILIHTKPSESNKIVKQKLEEILFATIKDTSVSSGDKAKLLLQLSEVTPSPVSVSVETSAIGFLMSSGSKDGKSPGTDQVDGANYCSPDTANILKAFIGNHPNIAAKYSPFIIESARQHFRHISRSQNLAENLEICNSLLLIFNRFKKKRFDWCKVGVYLIGDIILCLMAVAQPELKQLLNSCAHTLLSISEDYTHEYISANLPAAANEVFKVVLEDFKMNVKFAGRNV